MVRNILGNILVCIKYFFLLSAVATPAFISGQDTGIVRYKPSAVLIPLGSTNNTGSYSNVYSRVTGRFRSYEGINLITNGPVLDRLLGMMPEDKGSDNFYEICDKVKKFAYEHFIDEIFLIKSGVTPDDLIDFCDIHIDDDMSFNQMNERTEQEKFTEYFVQTELTNFFAYGDSGLRYNNPDFLNFKGKFHIKDLKTGKKLDLEKYLGRLVVLAQFPASGFDFSKYNRMKDIFFKLNYKFPDIVTIFGLYDSSANGKNFKGGDVLKEMGVLADPGLAFPVADVTSLPRDGHDEEFFGACYYGYLTPGGMTNRQFDAFAHNRLIFRRLEDIIPPEKRDGIRTTLVEAARDDDLSRVNRLIKEGADPLFVEDSRYALDWAVYYNNSVMIEALTGTNTESDDIYHAAYMAIVNGKKEIFAGLAEKIGRSGKPVVWKLRYLYSLAEKASDKDCMTVLDKSFPAIAFFLRSDFTFESLIASGIKPGIDPDYPFPVSPQPFKSHECELYAMKHLLKYKYNFNLDIPKWEKKMKKGPRDYWFFSQDADVAYGEGFDFEFYTINKADPGIFFYYLSKGEPVITERIFGQDRHSVVAYSWDANGVWLSDSGNGKRWVIPAEKLLTNNIFTMRIIKKAGPK